VPILGSQGSGAKGAPGAPTVGTATVTNSTTVSLAFTAPDSKLPITSYTVTSSPSIALSTSGTTSPLTVTGSFALNQAYTFTITATSSAGTSASSSASNSITPSLFTYFMGYAQNFLNGSNSKDIIADSSGNLYLGSTPGTNTNNYNIAKYNSGRSLEWQYDYNSSYELLNKITVDSSNNIYIAGQQGSGDSYGANIVKLDSSGVIQWQKILGPSSNATLARGVAVDSSGNVYISGTSGSNATTYGLIAKYNSSGTLQWQKRISNSGAAGIVFNDIALDSSGNPHVCGNFAGDFLVMKFDSSGAIVWQKRLGDGGSTDERSVEIGIDSSNNVYITGKQEYQSGNSDSGIYTAKYNSSGTLQWQRRLNYPSGGFPTNETGEGIGVDSSGNVYVGGQSNFDGLTDFILAKYNTSGTIQWQRRIGSGKQESLFGLNVDPSGNVYVAGNTQDFNNTTQGFFAALPGDGTKTGSYEVGPRTMVYSSINFTSSDPGSSDQTPSLTVSNESLSDSSTSISRITGTLSFSITTI
jgi:hypothetical protein